MRDLSRNIRGWLKNPLAKIGTALIVFAGVAAGFSLQAGVQLADLILNVATEMAGVAFTISSPVTYGQAGDNTEARSASLTIEQSLPRDSQRLRHQLQVGGAAPNRPQAKVTTYAAATQPESS